MRILLLSAYRSDSHAAWADTLPDLYAADWRVLELPGRYFRWRIRGNPLSWLDQISALLGDWQPDVVLATSMVDLATLRGLHPRLAAVPALYYFHENQFAYPQGEGQHASIDPQMVQLYGALAADSIAFNSAFNRDSFMQGIEQLWQKLPDALPADIVPRLQQRSRVLPVAVKPVSMGTKNPQLIVWNHRWEYDKKPDDFLAVLQRLAHEGRDFQLALLGPRPERTPPALAAIRYQFADRIVVDGRVSRAEYEQWLGRGQVVLSTAIHEFQGLSMLEAASAGCVPIVPDDLCYREQYPASHGYPAGDLMSASQRVMAALDGQLAPVNVSSWLAEQVSPQWQHWLRAYESM